MTSVIGKMFNFNSLIIGKHFNFASLDLFRYVTSSFIVYLYNPLEGYGLLIRFSKKIRIICITVTDLSKLKNTSKKKIIFFFESAY